MLNTKVKIYKQIIQHFLAFPLISRHTVIQKRLLTACLFSILLTPALLVYPASADDLFPVLVRGIEKSLPAGWSIDGKPYHYDNATLYTYINGGADIFLKHGFKQLIGAVCKSESPPADSVTIDIYDLSSEQNASALFGRKKSGSALQIHGAGAACEGKVYLCMYKGRFYVEIQAGQIKRQSPDFLKNIAENLLKSLP